MSSASLRLRSLVLASAASLVSVVAQAQTGSPEPLPTIVVQAPQSSRAVARRPAPAASAIRPAAAPVASSANERAASLTVLTARQALREIQQTPGGVALVPATEFKNSPASTIKDALGWVPGMLIQTRWGPDGRVSIRGSGLTRNYGNRGINVFMDGMPLNTADGLFDLFEVDPTAYRYVEVYKGANALRFGANSLGGAINFVMPTGRDASAFDSRIDAGSFGYVKTQASTGGVAGPADWFVTASAQREDGYRDHSKTDSERLNANIGYRFSPDAETRFYLNAGRWRAEIPGEVTKDAALNSPRAANPEFVRQDQQRNIDSLRLANKTTLRFDNTTVDFGLFGLDRHVMHPIFQWLDFKALDYGAFVRAADDRLIGGHRNRLVTGVNLHNGTIDIDQYVNLDGAVKGPLASSYIWKSENLSAYGENSFYFLPSVAAVVGGQFLHAVRNQQDRFLTDGDQSGSRSYDIFSPKLGLLWDVDPTWQVFANVSRSAEVPTFDVTTFATPASTNINAQTATTYEIGTRGRRRDVALYYASLHNELQCLTTGPYSPCSVVNADRTVHQGVEAGFGVAFLKSVFAQEDRVWFNASYTYSDFRFDNDPAWGNNRLPGAPPHLLRAEVMYKNPNGFYAGPNVEWMPQAFFSDNANTLTVDPYALLNFKIGYDRGIGWSGYVEARNLLDTRYISTTITVGRATPTMELFNPGTGRAIYGGLRYRL
ncbi:MULTISPECIES: TonB-dependent receptor [Rhodopseudomonas]|uniref:Ligand-gated channel protein n=1 Tax=Rhodopseudomonas palustris TaxID=1076 RepID=A0A0D7EIH9_RHOPL|nr:MULTISPECIES: TonB-dependent receptor [Rhodopseudomonas]KIZ40649.1 ligand-gated channel protein [Rhodopseudomonas palustris]MDF3808960.1 TonB-dependent receptor [Rhodopseudomonas sp. BAL398]WOK20042.1 TonB-dependent receptor [Rhodopseudomonas sp. BAL398]